MIGEAIKELRYLCKELKVNGEYELADKVRCAIAALTDVKDPRPDLSYSYVMRDLRMNHPDKVHDFQVVFKNTFDRALDADSPQPEEMALMAALKKIDVEID